MKIATRVSNIKIQITKYIVGSEGVNLIKCHVKEGMLERANAVIEERSLLEFNLQREKS